MSDVVTAALGVFETHRRTLESISVPLHRTATLALAPLFLEGARAGYDTNFAGAFGTRLLSRVVHEFLRAGESAAKATSCRSI